MSGINLFLVGLSVKNACQLASKPKQHYAYFINEVIGLRAWRC